MHTISLTIDRIQSRTHSCPFIAFSGVPMTPLVFPSVFSLPITHPRVPTLSTHCRNPISRSSLTAAGLPIGYHTNSSFAGSPVYHLPLLRRFPTPVLPIHRIPHRPRASANNNNHDTKILTQETTTTTNQPAASYKIWKSRKGLYGQRVESLAQI